ncbi:MAG: antitoxin PHD [Veillonella sp.]|nr:antitoxin PHD [Veillonella sp.]
MKIDKSYSNTININDTTTNILQAKIDLLSALVEGQNDIIQGRILSLEKSFDSIDQMLDKI